MRESARSSSSTSLDEIGGGVGRGEDEGVIKRESSLDMDYGWGGGRFGKRMDSLGIAGRFGRSVDRIQPGKHKQ